MGQERGDPPLQLTEVLPGDPECIKQVKKLVIRMCDRDPKRRPKAATVTDALSQSLSEKHGFLPCLCALELYVRTHKCHKAKVRRDAWHRLVDCMFLMQRFGASPRVPV